MKRKLFLLCALLFVVHNIFSQTELKLFLRDGNIISGTSALSKITLATDFGKLEIPIKNVSSIEFGIKPNGTSQTKVENLIKQLANSSEEMRKAAYTELVKLEIESIPVLSNFLNSEKYVSTEFTDFTAEMALTELKQVHNIKDNFSEKDVVGIDYTYTMGGFFDLDKIELKTEYGTLSVLKSKIEKMEISYFDSNNSNNRNFTLQASKHISSNVNGGWLKTGINIKPGKKINISASGEVTFASLSGSKYKPNGTVSSTNTDDFVDSYNNTSTYPAYGNVVFKIGESGAVQKAGAQYKGNANTSGMLYISIYETVYNSANTGSYTVNVNVQ